MNTVHSGAIDNRNSLFTFLDGFFLVDYEKSSPLYSAVSLCNHLFYFIKSDVKSPEAKLISQSYPMYSKEAYYGSYL